MRGVIAINQCYGYMQCKEQALIEESWCYGAFSCNTATEFISNDKAECYGSRSCPDIETLQITNHLLCFASESCAGSRGDVKYLNCVGTKSCIETAINVTNHVSGTHMAGFGSSLECLADSVCTLKCYSTGCYMVKLKGTWNIIKNSEQTVGPSTDRLDDIDPLFNASLFNISNPINNDNACNQQRDEWLFDLNEERKGGDNIMYIGEGVVCCRGQGSCRYISNISIQTASHRALICSGISSCRESGIHAINGAVICEGFVSCWKSTITSNNVICEAHGSCWESNIVSDGNASNIYCFGSCARSTISIANSGNANIYFFGAFSGQQASINCDEGASCSIFCVGDKSCKDITLQGIGKYIVYCDYGDDTDCPLTMAPSQIAPSLSPSLPPTLAPSQSPTACPDYNISQYSNDGIDMVYQNEIKYEVIMMKLEKNKTFAELNIMYYLSDENLQLFRGYVFCDNDKLDIHNNVNDVCYIDCVSTIACGELNIIPNPYLNYLSELIILCDA
eukprot:65661_1